MSERANDDVIRASEIGEYVHCERAWWLGHVVGVENANRAWLDAGTERHRAHGQRVWRAVMLQYAAWIFVMIAIGTLILLIARVFNLF